MLAVSSLLLASGVLLGSELPIATPVDPASVAVPAADSLPPPALLIAVLVPLLIAGLKKVFPKIPSALLPVLAPVLGGVIEAIITSLGHDAGGLVSGAVAGAAGTGVREIVDQNRKRIPGASAPLCFLSSLLFLSSGCLSRTMTRYDPETGKKWSTESFRVVLMRGEASKLREQVKETAAGDYDRDVSIGSLKGETETDKLKELLGEVAERAAKGAVKP